MKQMFDFDTIHVGYFVRVLEGHGRVIDLWRDCNQWYVELLMDESDEIKSIPLSHVVSIIGMMGKPIRLNYSNSEQPD